MAAQISRNRQMFWRITRRMLGAHRGRLFVVLLALGAGAAVTAALLNLQVDAKKRLASEFQAFGANILVAPPHSPAPNVDFGALNELDVAQALGARGDSHVYWAPFLYFVANVQMGGEAFSLVPHKQLQMIAVGTSLGAPLDIILPGWRRPPLEFWDESDLVESEKKDCLLGVRAAEQLHVQKGELLEVFDGSHSARLKIIDVVSTGGDEDNQLFLGLETAQALTGRANQASVVQIAYLGTTKQIEEFRANLAADLPDLEVHSLRQFTETQAKIYRRISGLLTATVVVVLVLTSLCVMAAMTNVAMERKNDVGLMKAIGGATRRVLRLFLAEAALLGLAGGALGAAAGILLSIWLGKQVFGVAAEPRLIVYPVAVALTVIVAILSAFPLRRLASIRPASVFRGEV
jgi:putative ABC transport system permease protein